MSLERRSVGVASKVCDFQNSTHSVCSICVNRAQSPPRPTAALLFCTALDAVAPLCPVIDHEASTDALCELLPHWQHKDPESAINRVDDQTAKSNGQDSVQTTIRFTSLSEGTDLSSADHIRAPSAALVAGGCSVPVQSTLACTFPSIGTAARNCITAFLCSYQAAVLCHTRAYQATLPLRITPCRLRPTSASGMSTLPTLLLAFAFAIRCLSPLLGYGFEEALLESMI